VSFKGGSPELSYRQQQGWTSGATIWVTQAGFPLGRSVYDKFLQGGSAKAPTTVPQFSDPTRFSSLATILANLVKSDAVLEVMQREGPLDGSVAASQPTLPGNDVTLPFVQIDATASSAGAATLLAEHAATALVRYVKNQQHRNAIPTDKRVVLQVIQHATPAVLTKPRKLTGPIVVFFATLMVAVGLAFLLENLRPRVQPVSDAAAGEAAVASARRTA
jgi:capsular polysaccharide biosynthesis protein